MRIGVIGLGTVGQAHLAALRQLDVSEIYGADPSAEARDYARIYATRCFGDFDEMLSAADLDGVVIATPPRTHREISLACLRAGLGVLTEKPLALTVEDCEVIANAAASSGGPFLVGFCHRFQPQVMRLRSLIDAGTLGRVVLANISFTHGLAEKGREWITDPEQAGGGVLFDSGSHAIDLFRYLVGDLDEIHGLTVGERAEIDDSSVVSLRSGAVFGLGLTFLESSVVARSDRCGKHERAGARGIRLRPRETENPSQRRRVANSAYIATGSLRAPDAPLPGMCSRRCVAAHERPRRIGSDSRDPADLR